jgi:hypothetical protein
MCSTSHRPVDEADPHAMSDAEVLAELADLVAEQNRVAARLTRAVRIADARLSCEHGGLKSMQSWLRAHTGMKQPSASALVHRGRVLDHLPATAAAFTAGAIGVDHVAEIGKITAARLLAAAADQGVDVGEVDQALATIAAGQRFGTLTEAVQQYLAKLDPDGPEPDPVEERSLSIVTHPDGRVTIHSELDPVGGEKAKAVLEPMAAASRTAGDDRTHSQRLAGRIRAVGGQHPRRRPGADPADPQARHRRGPRPGRPRRPGHRQDHRTAGLRCHHLRRPRPLAGLRLHRGPHRHGPHRGTDPPRPGGPHRPRPAAAPAGPARRRLRRR